MLMNTKFSLLRRLLRWLITLCLLTGILLLFGSHGRKREKLVLQIPLPSPVAFFQANLIHRKYVTTVMVKDTGKRTVWYLKVKINMLR